MRTIPLEGYTWSPTYEGRIGSKRAFAWFPIRIAGRWHWLSVVLKFREDYGFCCWRTWYEEAR